MKQRRLQRKEKRDDPRGGGQGSKGGPDTKIDPRRQRPWMDEGGEGKWAMESGSLIRPPQ